MTPTPERALWLAEMLGDLRLAVFSDSVGNSPDLFVAAELIGMLRAYADIAPKYQAVLDAEPVASVEGGQLDIDGAWCGVVSGIIADCQLIIKPTP